METYSLSCSGLWSLELDRQEPAKRAGHSGAARAIIQPAAAANVSKTDPFFDARSSTQFKPQLIMAKGNNSHRKEVKKPKKEKPKPTPTR